MQEEPYFRYRSKILFAWICQIILFTYLILTFLISLLVDGSCWIHCIHVGTYALILIIEEIIQKKKYPVIAVETEFRYKLVREFITHMTILIEGCLVAFLIETDKESMLSFTSVIALSLFLYIRIYMGAKFFCGSLDDFGFDAIIELFVSFDMHFLESTVEDSARFRPYYLHWPIRRIIATPFFNIQRDAIFLIIELVFLITSADDTFEYLLILKSCFFSGLSLWSSLYYLFKVKQIRKKSSFSQYLSQRSHICLDDLFYLEKIHILKIFVYVSSNPVLLKSIDLSNQPEFFSSIMFLHLAEALQKNTHLESLSLNSLGIEDQGVHYLSKGLDERSCLVNLSLKSNRITHTGMQSLVESLVKNNKLHSLDLFSNCIASNGGKEIVRLLTGNEHLEELKIGMNHIDDQTASAIFMALTQKNKTLTSLDIRCNELANETAFQLNHHLVSFDILANAHCSHLLSLNISSNDLGKEELFQKITEGLAKNPPLKALIMQDCSIYADGFGLLGEALKSNTNLEILKLDNNHARDGGVKKLFCPLLEAEGNKVALNTISLANNSLQNNAVVFIGQFMQLSEKIRKIKLKENDLLDDGVVTLSSYIPMSKSIQILNLSNCKFGIVGLRSLVSSLKSNNSVKELNLSENELKDDVAELILSPESGIIQRLKILDLSENEFSLVYISKFKEYVGKCNIQV